MDFVMRQFRNVARNEHTAFVLLEADQATYETWDQPLYFHRDRVQQMIEYSSNFEYEAESTLASDIRPIPALIVVDIELNRPGDPIASEELKAYLQRYSKADNPPLVLVRTLKLSATDSVEDNIPRERPSFLDPVIADASNQNIFWASPHFALDDDYRIRRWLLWLRTRDGAQLSSLPSVQLVAQILLSEKSEQAPAARYQELIAKLDSIDSCDPHTMGDARPTIDIHRGGESHVIDLCDELTSQRLIYGIPYTIPQGQLRPKVGGVVPVLQRVGAMNLSQLDRGFLGGSVVVVGGTYFETRDWHATPIGEMPGAVVLINAVHSLGANGLLEPPSAVTKMLIVVPLVLLMVCLFAWLDTALAYLAASAVVLVLLVPISFFMFASGVWLDFALPLLAVQIHEFAAEYESRIHKPVMSADARSLAEAAATETAEESSEEDAVDDKPTDK